MTETGLAQGSAGYADGANGAAAEGDELTLLEADPECGPRSLSIVAMLCFGSDMDVLGDVAASAESKSSCMNGAWTPLSSSGSAGTVSADSLERSFLPILGLKTVRQRDTWPLPWPLAAGGSDVVGVCGYPNGGVATGEWVGPPPAKPGEYWEEAMDEDMVGCGSE